MSKTGMIIFAAKGFANQGTIIILYGSVPLI